MASATTCVHYGKTYCGCPPETSVWWYGCTLLDQLCDYDNGGNAEDCSHYSSSGCFMTSACVGYMGKPDDCVELETMRHFRDEKLSEMEGGKALIGDYYRIAPLIVKAIDKSERKEEYYQDIYDTVRLCCQSIEEGDDKKAISSYLDMFYKYRSIFGV